MIMKKEKKDTYHHGDLKAEFIKIGMKILREEGINSLSLREISRRVGVSATAAYRHFNDKNHILEVLIVEIYKLLANDLKKSINNITNDLYGGFGKLCWSYISFALNNPNYFKLIFREQHTDNSQSILELSQEVSKIWLNLVIKNQKEGVFREDDPRKIHLAIWSIIQGIVILLINKQLPGIQENEEKIKNITNILLDLLFKGIKKPD